MRDMFKIRIMVFAAVVAAAASFVGCASAPLSTEVSTSGIRAAEEAGAANVPRASLHLQLAKEELALAKRLAESGDKYQAASILLRAEADAELAVILSRGDAEKSEAQAAAERVRQLRQDNP
jgi:Spy/CpxP family protein refolding chaperone